MLLDHDANADAQNGQGDTPLHMVSRGAHDHDDGIARLLLEHSMDVNVQNTVHETPLHLAALAGKLEIARLLLEHGANPNVENKQGETPLHSVSQIEYNLQEHGVSIARLLLEHGVDVNAREKDQDTPLHLAAFSGRLHIAQVPFFCLKRNPFKFRHRRSFWTKVPMQTHRTTRGRPHYT